MDWKDLDSSRIYQQHSSFIIVKPRDSVDPAPLFCSVCGSLSTTIDDVISHKQYGCCSLCNLRWVDINRDEWLKGWRPDSDSIAVEMQRRNRRKAKTTT